MWSSRSVVCIPADASKVGSWKDEEGNIFFQNWKSLLYQFLGFTVSLKKLQKCRKHFIMVIKDGSVRLIARCAVEIKTGKEIRSNSMIEMKNIGLFFF